MKKSYSVQELFDFCSPLISETIGDPNTQVSSFSNAGQGESGALTFINQSSLLKDVLASEVSAVIVPVKLKDSLPSDQQKVFLLSANPELAARNIKNEFVLATPYRDTNQGVHPTAFVHETAELHESVSVGPNAFVGAGCRLAKDCFIGANAVIEQNVTMGAGTTIHPQAYIGHSCVIGRYCEVMPQAVIGSEGFGYAHDHHGNHYRVPHTGRVILEDDVHIGACCAIDRGTIEDSVIGKGTKLDNQIHLAHNIRVGKNGLMTANAVVAGSTTIGDNFVCGGNTSITGHVTITDNVQVAGLCGVTNSVREPGQYGGYPLVPLKKHLKAVASLVHLPEMRKQMAKLLRKNFPEDYR